MTPLNPFVISLNGASSPLPISVAANLCRADSPSAVGKRRVWADLVQVCMAVGAYHCI
jgi:hypothetical protein